MATSFRPIFLFCFLLSLFLSSSAQSCSNYAFSSNRAFTTCNSLPQLNAHLHWTYNPSRGTIDVAYRATQSSTGWVAWAINPTGLQMAGSQALVAYQSSSNGIRAYTTSVSSTMPSMQPGNLSFNVSGITAQYVSGEFIIFATVTLPSNKTTVNQVWQAGPLSNDAPSAHPTTGANVRSLGTLDLLSGLGTTAGGGNSRLRRKNVSSTFISVKERNKREDF